MILNTFLMLISHLHIFLVKCVSKSFALNNCGGCSYIEFLDFKKYILYICPFSYIIFANNVLLCMNYIFIFLMVFLENKKIFILMKFIFCFSRKIVLLVSSANKDTCIIFLFNKYAFNF